MARRVRDGYYTGSLLPSEPQLMVEFGLSRPMVRLAMDVLRAQGLVVTEHGRGTFVPPKLPVRRMASSRYRVDAAAAATGGEPATSFTADQGITWEQYRLDKEFAEVPAPGEVAELLGVAEGSALLRRDFVFWSKGYPQQMSASYLLWDLVAGTPVADPEREPWPGGTIGQLATLGVVVTAVEEQVGTRMPTAHEADTLRIPPGVPVLTITRRMLAGERPMEVAADIVIPGDRGTLDYRIDL